MTYIEMIDALRYYTHHFAEQPFDPGVASMIAHKLEQLSEKLEAAKADIKMAIKNNDAYCELCKHKVECKGKECPEYIEGVGATDTNGHEFPDFKWSCLDFNFGQCPLLDNTPCCNCDFENNWQWRYE